MDIDQGRIDSLVAALSESLNVEVKSWINPDQPEGLAKIVRGVFALRNRNGGFFVIGFDDKTLAPDNRNRPKNLRQVFHIDKIQGIITQYAAEGFEIGIGYAQLGSHEYPVIVVPEGNRSPLASRRDLKDGQRFLIREGDVYFRTLKSNGTPSTAKIRPNDWPQLLEICLENRDADIGRFLRRHLTGAAIEKLMEVLQGLTPTPASPSLRERTQSLLASGKTRFDAAIEVAPSDQRDLVKDKGTWAVSLVVDPPLTGDPTPNRTFRNTVSAANPSYTGWPVWLDSSNFGERRHRPIVFDNAWQASIISLAKGWSNHVDFMRLDPKGEFYLIRVLEDDLSGRVSPRTTLDPILVVLRVAETIAVGLSIAKALGVTSDSKLAFGFRWTGLAGRTLDSWAVPMATISPGYNAHDNTADSFVEVPLDTASSAIAPYVQTIVKRLFVTFDGYEFPESAIEHWVQRLIERRLP